MLMKARHDATAEGVWRRRLCLCDGFNCSCQDSYDYTLALEKVLPSVAKFKTEMGGFLVLRPDSGDPVQVIIQALQ
jgi:nicotinic acid phosphoribosyltransferase